MNILINIKQRKHAVFIQNLTFLVYGRSEKEAKMNCTRNFLEAINDDQDLQIYLKESSNYVNKSIY